MANLALILGGVRSGKSRFAQQLAQRLGGEHVLFLATAQAGDDEMRRRILSHQQQRPLSWQTVEASVNIAAAIRQAHKSVILIDCLTLLVSNVMLACGADTSDESMQSAVELEIDQILGACAAFQGRVIVVSSEVGSGVVPDSRLGRLFRDVLGRANQTVAARAQAVYCMFAGLAVEVKALATAVELAAKTLG